MRRDITVCVSLQGWHSWPDAPGRRSYLRSLHRHMFEVVATVPVFHDDREVEFHDLRDAITAWWGSQESQENRGSCEQIADELREHLTRLLLRDVVVSVGEDGEAWATVRPA